MRMILANGKTVKVSLGEIREFVTEMKAPVPNPDWHYSELLTEDEVMRFLKGESTREELQKVAQYLLIYTENLAFYAYLFNKANGGDPEGPKDFSMPTVKKLRNLYRKAKDNPSMETIYEMESVCLEIGADPL